MIQISVITFLQVKNQCPCQMEVPVFFSSWPNLLPNKYLMDWNHFWKKLIQNSFCWISFPLKYRLPNMLCLLTTVAIISKSMQDSLSFAPHLVPTQSFDLYFLYPLRVPISSAKAQTMCWTDSSGPVMLFSQESGTTFATTTFQREGSSACTTVREHWSS